MAYEVKPNTFSLFKNDRKETDSHPDYKGSGMIEGLGDCWADAWVNEIRSGENAGKKYLAVKVKPKDQTNTVQRQATGSQGAPMQRAGFDDDLDDSVPFASSDPALEWRVG